MRAWAIATIVVAMAAAIAISAFDSNAQIHRIRPYIADAGKDTLSSDGAGLDGFGYKWIACASVGDSSDTDVFLSHCKCGCTIKPNENAVLYADSLVRGVGFMARLSMDNDSPEGFSWMVVKF